MEQRKWKNRNFWTAFKHSLDGLKYLFQQERNSKIQLILAILAVGLGMFFELDHMRFAIIFITIGLVLFAEMINTAIEVMLDLYSNEYNEKIKLAKDIASGAVLFISCIAIIVGCCIFVPEILNKLGEM